MGKLDQYCFDGTNALSLKKLPTEQATTSLGSLFANIKLD